MNNTETKKEEFEVDLTDKNSEKDLENPDPQIQPGHWFKDMPFKYRLFLFILLNAAGFGLQMYSFSTYLKGIHEMNPVRFGLLYSLGNVLALLGMWMLVGIREQYRMMSHDRRRCTSLVFILSMIACLFIPFMQKGYLDKILICIAVFIQMVSYWWYALSYIPWLQDCIRSCCSWLNCCFGKKET